MIKSFWERILDAEDPLSAKRFVTLIIAAHFIIASFVVLFIAFYVIFYTPKGRVDKDLLDLLKDVLKDDFMVIIGGLGLVTASGFANVLIASFKSRKKDEEEEDTKEPSIKDEPE